jgi:hypothetical protein
LNTTQRIISSTVKLNAGEGVFSVAKTGGLMVSAAGSINYMAKTSGGVVSGNGNHDIGTTVVTYNFNIDYESTAETGKTAPAAIVASPVSASMSLSGAEEEPRAFMIDLVLDGFGKGAFKH